MLAPIGEANDYVDTAALTINASNELVLTLGRTGTLTDVVSAPLVLPDEGLMSVATNTAFGGDGTAADPLSLERYRRRLSDHPDRQRRDRRRHRSQAARSALGLGSAALADTGAADGDVALLGAGGVFPTSVFAVGGNVGDYFERTAAGAQWTALPPDTNEYVDTAALTLNSTSELVLTLGRSGSLSDISTAPLALPAGGNRWECVRE